MSNCKVIRSKAELPWIHLMECQNVKSTIYLLKSLMPKAIWNGTVLAQSDQTILVEGNHYFPPESINQQYLQDSNFMSLKKALIDNIIAISVFR